jgi:energy-converting hydrogenase Eha subunit E
MDFLATMVALVAARAGVLVQGLAVRVEALGLALMFLPNDRLLAVATLLEANACASVLGTVGIQGNPTTGVGVSGPLDGGLATLAGGHVEVYTVWAAAAGPIRVCVGSRR